MTYNTLFIYLFFSQDLITQPKIQESIVLHEVAMLGYGTLVAKYCEENPSCPVDFVKVRVTYTAWQNVSFSGKLNDFSSVYSQFMI